ncbi:MAG: HNH endonuclease [Lachnospiraceae bacterium]|nr:HNH endonuclease [Lachnospiraceae bacterium]MDD7047548.1 HNH endonuclease signature motif containing protein [Lachnospiraceae bacterium]
MTEVPYRTLHPCAADNCPELVPTGQKYCEKHKKMHPEEARSALARGYGRRWQKASKAFLASQPLCEECLKRGRYAKATVVDHIVPHRGDPKLFWDRNNWRALCKRCHDKKTGREDSHPVYRY